MVSVCNGLYVVCSEQINGVVTSGITYEVLYTTELNDEIYYELENDKGEYISINSKYFKEVL